MYNLKNIKKLFIISGVLFVGAIVGFILGMYMTRDAANFYFKATRDEEVSRLAARARFAYKRESECKATALLEEYINSLKISSAYHPNDTWMIDREIGVSLVRIGLLKRKSGLEEDAKQKILEGTKYICSKSPFTILDQLRGEA